MKFQAKFLKVSGVQDSQGDKYTQVQLRLFHQPDPNKQEETTRHVSMFLMGLMYEKGNVLVEITPDDELVATPEETDELIRSSMEDDDDQGDVRDCGGK